MMDHNEYNKYLDRKLAHYNVWLVDNSREIGKPYPGFPEDMQARPVKYRMKNMQTMNAFEQLDHDLAQRKAKPKAAKVAKEPKAPKAPRASGPTKADRALEIFKRLGGDKAAVIAAIKDELSMSDAGATTYFYNAKKLAK
ncbi:MAG: hypothetical protein EBU08_23405 [Micrococcales bacterium]|nr:hypothetical protein [Micrococcales bacterium]